MKFYVMWWEWYLFQTEVLYDYFNEYHKTLRDLLQILLLILNEFKRINYRLFPRNH